MAGTVIFETAFGVSNIIIPQEGPKCVPCSLPFDSGDANYVDIDSSNIFTQGAISFLQGVFIDNADNDESVSITCNQTGHRIVAAPHTQGFYPMFAPTPPLFTAYCATATAVSVKLMFYNVPIQGQTWATN